MTETTTITPTHPFTQELNALTEGSTIEYSLLHEDLYFDVTTNPEAMYSLISGESLHYKFRVKPNESYIINGVTSYKPLGIAELIVSKMYFVESTASQDFYSSGWYYGDNRDMYSILCARGIVHDSKDKAIHNCKARLGLLEPDTTPSEPPTPDEPSTPVDPIEPDTPEEPADPIEPLEPVEPTEP